MRAATAERLARTAVVREPLLVGWRRGWIPSPAGDVEVTLQDGRHLAGSLADATQRRMLLGAFEPEETAFVRGALSSGQVFVDVGAHIGWFATLAGRLVEPVGRVFAFEPYPRSVERLRRNVELNGLDNVEVYNLAVSDSGGTLALGVQPGSDSGSVTSDFRGMADRCEVATARLDEVLTSTERIALLKIDVEGSEEAVLSGAEATLPRIDSILIELNESALAAHRSSPAAVRRILREHGFTVQRTIGGMRLARWRAHGRTFTNLLASRA